MEWSCFTEPLNLNWNSFIFTENKFVYFIAIIDPLTNYGFKKQVYNFTGFTVSLDLILTYSI